MEGYGPATYGESFADVYDDWYASLGDDDAAVVRLAQLARGSTAAAVDLSDSLISQRPEHGGGPSILELGVGTGRLAIPLAERGFDVWGIDASPAMLDRLRHKPGGARVRTVEADMADIGTGLAGLGDRRFDLVFAAFNTFFNLTSEADQLRCLAGAAAHLAPGGRVVIEAFVPSETTPAGGVVEVRSIEPERVVLSVSLRRPDDQVVDGQHVELSATGNRMRPWRIRYLTPDQLDRLADASGLTLIQRSAGWRDEPFDDTSAMHVSIYGARPAPSVRPATKADR